MGNVYRYGECDSCRSLTDADLDYTFIVHGSRGLGEIKKLEDMGRVVMPVGKIAAHFCGYCGGYVPMEDMECGCGHFDYQGWNYPESDGRHWKEPSGWDKKPKLKE